MSILSCVILFKSSTMMQIWWPYCALFPPLYRNLTANMIQNLSAEVLPLSYNWSRGEFESVFT